MSQKASDSEKYEDYWRSIDTRRQKRYSEGDILQFPHYFMYLRNTLVEEFVAPSGDCLSVELGCGRATTSLFLAKRGWQPVLMDLSQSALDLARRNFSEERASCFLVRGNMSSVPFPDDSFNAVLSIGSPLVHFEDIDQPLREMIRILKPGGTFCASVMYNRRFSVQTLVNWLYHIPGTIVKHGLFRRDPLKAKAMVRSWLWGDDYYENELSMENYVAAMRKLGLIDVTAVPCTTIPSLRLPRFLESFYVRLLKVFCAIKRRLTRRHPLRALWGGRRMWYFFGQKPFGDGGGTGEGMSQGLTGYKKAVPS